MEDNDVQKIIAHPKFTRLVSTRNRFATILTIVMLLAYYGYIGLIAFDKQLLATRLGDGVITLGIPIGFGLIVLTVLLTGIYVKRANGEFDRLKNELLEEVKNESK